MKKKKHVRFNNKHIKLLSSNYSEELHKLDFEKFEVIDDFKIEIYDTNGLGLHLYFTNTKGILSSFPWWDYVDEDLRNMTQKNIPLGTIDAPFDDLEQGWQLIIFEYDKFVYILEGNDPCTTKFSTWYSVSSDLYINEWKRILNDFT